MNKKKAKVYSYKINEKDIKFIPMHHLGKKEFYDDIKNKVVPLKAEGYVVYYELINTKVDIDSLQKDILRRKWRKIKGFSGTYKEAAQDASFFKKHIQQPDYEDMGVTDSDIRADVNALQFIEEWENKNGKVILDSLDLNTPFDAKYESRKFYTKKQWNDVAIKYRNQYATNLIKQRNDKKIIIIYGKAHKKDLIKQLKNNN